MCLLAHSIGYRLHDAARTSVISATTRSFSTGFHVTPSTFRLEPTMAPSANCNSSAAFDARNPVLTRTGTPESFTAAYTSARLEASAGWLVIGPETQSASGIEEKTTERATSGNGRGAICAANSALILKI